jgi:hypothetical protein
MEVRYFLVVPTAMRICTSLPESEFSSPSTVAVVSCPDIGVDFPLLGVVGGSCGGSGMLLI